LGEANIIASLHTQAAGIQGIQTLVPDVLDVHSTQYSRWRDIILLTLERYDLDDHITSDVVTSTLPRWRWMDSVVLSWLLGTLIVDLQATIHEHGDTACHV
jgi:hypothetical protein